LIDQARKQGDAEEKIRCAREAIYRFMTAIAGNAPELTETHRARLFLMQQANRLFYAMVTLNFVAAARPEMRLTKGDIEEAAQNIKASEELGRSSNPETKAKLACALLNDVLRGFESSNYTSALSFLSISDKPARRRKNSAQERT
jgi:hypothetical protein